MASQATSATKKKKCKKQTKKHKIDPDTASFTEDCHTCGTNCLNLVESVSYQDSDSD